MTYLSIRDCPECGHTTTQEIHGPFWVCDECLTKSNREEAA